MKLSKNFFSTVLFVFLSINISFAMDAPAAPTLDVPLQDPLAMEAHEEAPLLPLPIVIASVEAKPLIPLEKYERVIRQLQKYTLLVDQKSELRTYLKSEPFTGAKRLCYSGSQKQSPKKRVCTEKNAEIAISPIKEKPEGIGPEIRERAIYGFFAHEQGDTSVIPKHDDRINFNTILGTPVTEENFWEALLAIEIQLRNLIKANPKLYYQTSYIGLAKDLGHRFSGHMVELRPVQERVKIDPLPCRGNSSRKERYMARVMGLGFAYTMSAMIYNIPTTPVNYLPVVEVLVGLQFNVLAKANSLLGDKEAWAKIDNYMAWSERIKKLKELGLERIVEDLDDRVFEATINPHTGG